MTEFSAAEATGDTPRMIACMLADRLTGSHGHNVGFVYVTSQLAKDLASVIASLKVSTGIEAWVGTAGHGVCAGGVEHWDRPAAVALTCRLAEGTYRLLPTIAQPDAAADQAGGMFAAGLGVVHADPRNGAVMDIVAALSRERGAYLVGGLTSSDGSYPQIAGANVIDGGVSGILLGGRLNVAVGLTQGCTPIGPAHEITRCEGQIIAGLDRHRAYDVMCEDVGIAEGADPRPWLTNVHAALPVPGSDEADYVVRHLIGIDPRQGLVAVAENLQPGDRVMFVRRDRESAEKDLVRMLTGLKARMKTPPKAGLYFSCVARGPNLFGEAGHEMRAIRETFGEIPVAGFFGNGEISNDRVYGYTGVLTLFA